LFDCFEHEFYRWNSYASLANLLLNLVLANSSSITSFMVIMVSAFHIVKEAITVIEYFSSISSSVV
jgi:hypothetical protein